MSSLSEDYKIVLAIDFGTTFSGYAFSSRREFQEDPLKISENQPWNAGAHQHISPKTPTCVLLDKDEKCVSFGYAAENKYNNLVEDAKHDEFFFFQRFKMKLYRQTNISRDMIIEDITGKPVKAIVVFAESIKALKADFVSKLKTSVHEVKDEEIRYVLTVPAIWSDAAKQIMRESAIKAGIENNQLVLALEPEAASIYCQYLPFQQLSGARKGIILSEQGMKYVIVDNGGGTCDITVHEKLCDGKLKELHRVSGADVGGTSVDQEFYQTLVRVFGAPVLVKLKEEDPSAYLDMFREFDAVKRTYSAENDDLITMAFPRKLLTKICKKHFDDSLENILKQSELHDEITVKNSKMILHPRFIKQILQNASTIIVSLVSDILKSKTCEGVHTIILVGGFSECKVFQNELRTVFPNCSVIVPENPVLCVVKGAVLFGHSPDYIVSRIARYTYGCEIRDEFNKKVHHRERLKKHFGKKFCDGCFDIYVKKGSETMVGVPVIKYSYTSHKFQSFVLVNVYKSTSECPLYIDDPSCSLVGTLGIVIPNPTKKKRILRKSFIFGNTELKVTVVDEQSGEKCVSSIDLI